MKLVREASALNSTFIKRKKRKITRDVLQEFFGRILERIFYWTIDSHTTLNVFTKKTNPQTNEIIINPCKLRKNREYRDSINSKFVELFPGPIQKKL